jgi:hypothetical protein
MTNDQQGAVTVARPGGTRTRQQAPLLLWHADPSLGDPDDDYAAALLGALAAEGRARLAAVVVNRRPAEARARQFGATLAALGIRHGNGQHVPVGTGAGSIGRPMPAIHPGAPAAAAPPPADGRMMQAVMLSQAPDASVTILATTALTDVDWLLATHAGLAQRKVRAIVMMSDARPGPAGTWIPGDAVNNLADPGAASRVFAALQGPAWRHVQATVVSRWAVLGAGEASPAFLDQLAAASPVAAWLRDRARHSINERWASFCRGEVPGRTRESFTASHLGGRDPGRGPGDPVYDLVTGIPLYDAVAALAAAEPWWLKPEPAAAAPNFSIAGTSSGSCGVADPAGLRGRLAGLLARGFAAA